MFDPATTDRIFTIADSVATPTEYPVKLNIVVTHTVTGGTGRFAGATGVIIAERVLDVLTLLSEGTITGTLLLP